MFPHHGRPWFASDSPSTARRAPLRQRRRNRHLRCPALEALEPRALLATVTWTGAAGDGLWDNPLNWTEQTTNGPVNVMPGPGDDAEIGSNAGTIGISPDDYGTADVNSLTCGAGSTIDVDGIDGLTIATLTVASGITLDGTIFIDEGCELIASGTETIAGDGEVTFGDQFFQTPSEGPIFNELAVGNGATLTIGAGITVQGLSGNVETTSGSIVNQGLISSTGGLAIFPSGSAASFDNLGTIQAVTGASLTVTPATMSSEGTIDAAGGTVDIVGCTLTPGAGSAFLMSGGGQIVLDSGSTLNNSGNTVSLDTSNGSFVLGGGTIEGGTISAGSPGSQITALGGSSLNGVTLDINLSETGLLGTVDVLDGLTLNGTVTLDNAANLLFEGTQTLSGDGEVVFGPDYFYDGNFYRDNALSTESLSSSVSTLTIGPSITVGGQLGVVGGIGSNPTQIVNQGTISSTGSVTITNTPFDNQGTVLADSGASLALDVIDRHDEQRGDNRCGRGNDLSVLGPRQFRHRQPCLRHVDRLGRLHPGIQRCARHRDRRHDSRQPVRPAQRQRAGQPGWRAQPQPAQRLYAGHRR